MRWCIVQNKHVNNNESQMFKKLNYASAEVIFSSLFLRDYCFFVFLNIFFSVKTGLIGSCSYYTMVINELNVISAMQYKRNGKMCVLPKQNNLFNKKKK